MNYLNTFRGITVVTPRAFARFFLLMLAIAVLTSCEKSTPIEQEEAEVTTPPTELPKPRLAVSVDRLYFDFNNTAEFLVTNSGDTGSILNWTLETSDSWLKVLSFQGDNRIKRGDTHAGGSTTAYIYVVNTYANKCVNEGSISITSNGGSKTIPATFVNPDGMYLHTHEGNNCTQDTVGYVAYKKGDCHNFKTDDIFVNDEARSLSLQCMPKDAVVEVFDDPLGRQYNNQSEIYDDWAKITVKQYIPSYCIKSLEIEGPPSLEVRYYEDEYVSVEYHFKNGLDGKVSRLCMR